MDDWTYVDNTTQEEKDATSLENLMSYCLGLSWREGSAIMIKRLIKEIEAIKMERNEDTHP